MKSAAQTQPRAADGGSWNRRVWRLAAPMIAANVTVPLLGAVDTAVVGHLPNAYYLGAVAVGAMIFSLLYWGLGFLRMATTGLTAQAHGGDDADEMRATLARSLIIAGALALAILALQAPTIGLAMGFFEASAEVESHARAYFAIRVWGAPAALANATLLGWFLGMQNARATLALQVVINAVNIVLDLWFVVGLGLAVEGVALATIIAEYTGLALGLVLVARTLRRLGGRWQIERIVERRSLRHLLATNRDIFLRTLCLMAAFAYLTAQGAKMGDVVLAANAVMMNLFMFMAFPLDGFAHAAEALVGRAVGARDRAALAGTVRASTLWALIMAVAFTAAYLVAGTLVIDALTNVDAVRAAAREVLPWMIAAPLISVWSFQFDGIFIGATRSAEMRNSMIVSLAVYLAATWTLMPIWGNHGLWFAFLIFMAARAATLAYYYPRIAQACDAAPGTLAR